MPLRDQAKTLHFRLESFAVRLIGASGLLVAIIHHVDGGSAAFVARCPIAARVHFAQYVLGHNIHPLYCRMDEGKGFIRARRPLMIPCSGFGGFFGMILAECGRIEGMQLGSVKIDRGD